jgi:hypothetical protein
MLAKSGVYDGLCLASITKIHLNTSSRSVSLLSSVGGFLRIITQGCFRVGFIGGLHCLGMLFIELSYILDLALLNLIYLFFG